ncbi:MAG: hypothetical protein ACK47M_03060 [Caldilinea sp.]
MNSVTVRIVGGNDAFAKTAYFVLERLRNVFGDQVCGKYYNAGEPSLTEFPPALALIRLGEAPLPLVFVDNDLVVMGGKISVPELRQRLTALGLSQV